MSRTVVKTKRLGKKIEKIVKKTLGTKENLKNGGKGQKVEKNELCKSIKEGKFQMDFKKTNSKRGRNERTKF